MNPVPLWTIALLLGGHWLFDFVWQPDWMAKAKSSSWVALLAHAGRIAIGAFITGLVLMLISGHHWIVNLWGFTAINAGSHLAIDAVTSRIAGRMNRKGDTHNFFVVIGFDQYLHVVIAIATMGWLLT